MKNLNIKNINLWLNCTNCDFSLEEKENDINLSNYINYSKGSTTYNESLLLKVSDDCCIEGKCECRTVNYADGVSELIVQKATLDPIKTDQEIFLEAGIIIRNFKNSPMNNVFPSGDSSYIPTTIRLQHVMLGQLVDELVVGVSEIELFTNYCIEMAKKFGTDEQKKFGEWCSNCLNKFNCNLAMDLVKKAVDIKDEGLNLENAKFVMRNSKFLKKVLSDAEELIIQTIESGQEVEGFSLVDKQGNRKWIDDSEKLIEVLTKIDPNLFHLAPVGITIAEKVLGDRKTLLTEVIDRYPTKKQLKF